MFCLFANVEETSDFNVCVFSASPMIFRPSLSLGRVAKGLTEEPSFLNIGDGNGEKMIWREMVMMFVSMMMMMVMMTLMIFMIVT